MHPYQHVFLHRGPSRIFWFFIGAGVATWWHHSSIMRDHRAQYFPCVMHRRVQDSPSDPPPQEAAPWKPSWGPDRTPAGWHQQRDWEQDKERLRHIQKRAGETVRNPPSIPPVAHIKSSPQVIDLSESTLDSIVTSAESLKAKLAELRAERERLEAEKKVVQPDA
ncbi:hypothetical protein JVT61DRAFT_212 [Boletus reticuloceps]|uniref:Uncharacterized protein n=1 Tax=Boletus reticuloceps TaxID=495285 RepID=A0A8I2Z0N7_9AGAM|nr:hypothetical protein JVT61DRAFT_212 [Boletus reticuloceps]